MSIQEPESDGWGSWGGLGKSTTSKESKKSKKKGRDHRLAIPEELPAIGESSSQGLEVMPEELEFEPPAFEEPPPIDPPMDDDLFFGNAPPPAQESGIEEAPVVSDPESIDDASEVLPLSTQNNPRQGQFQSNIFKLRVGPKKELFTAHGDVLAKSPKLDRQCNGDFEEAKRKRIDLDHDPKTFALLLEFLYTGDYWPFLGEEFRENRSEDEDVRATQLQREGDLYCLAEYYQMDDLQELAVKKMQMLTPLTFESFLSVSEYIYNNSGTTGPFREYFRLQIQKTLSQVVHEGWMLEVVAKGGDLVKDLFLSYRRPQAAKDEDSDDKPAVKVTWEDDAAALRAERDRSGKRPADFFKYQDFKD